MLRIAAKKSAGQNFKGTRQQSFQTGTQAAPKAPVPGPPSASAAQLKKSGGSGGLKFTLAAITAGATGIVGYAYVDPEFRNKVETNIPQVKPVFDKILGQTSLLKTKQQIADLKEQVASAIPKKKEESILPPLAKPSPPLVEKREPIYVEPVDVHKEIDVLPPKPSPDYVATHNKKLEQTLLSAIHQAEVRVQAATEAKIQTISAVNEHANLLKKTVDNPQNANWESVTMALQQAESLSSKDGNAEANSRNYIDQLRNIIESGKSDPLTTKNPLLLNATETANKLTHQLDELNGLVSKARQESQILNQYKDLIERSRQQFAFEMKSILPNVDIHAKDKNLNEDELNALIAHAHLKVDQLRKQLSDQQVREEQHIAKAIEEQRRADERVAAERLAIELNRVKSQQELDVEKAVLASRSTWEGELEDQLKRASAAHSEHLEQVIRTQRQLFEIEHNQKVEEAVLVEREHHSRVVGAALSRLEGIEHALTSRVALDAENRKIKQFWIACHNLIDTIKHGNKAGNDIEERRLSLSEALVQLQQVIPDDTFVSSIIAIFPAQSKSKGLYTEQDLRNRFDKIYQLGRKTSGIDNNGGTISQYIWSYVRSLFLLELPKKFTETDIIDPLAIDNIEILARAKWYVERGDLNGAVKLAQLLHGQPAELAQDWLQDTRAHLESRLLAELLVAHAAVSSIRSTY